MSKRYPIIAVTGSSGAGTTTTGQIFGKLFAGENLRAAMISGDSFHKYTRQQMNRIADEGRYGQWNHFSIRANHVDKLEALFQDYGASGAGQYRHYVHDDDRDLIQAGYVPGEFTPWRALPPDTDLLFYEGLHGGLVTDEYNVAQHVDLLVGIVPIVNLEWIQKIHRDTRYRGYEHSEVVETIVTRMNDYVNDIVPQFANTHINFQRVPTVDTSNPFTAKEIPTDDESLIVIHFRDGIDVDFQRLLQMISGSFMSRHDTIVIPGTKLPLAVDLILRPMIRDLMDGRRYAW